MLRDEKLQDGVEGRMMVNFTRLSLNIRESLCEVG
jgi:hypothetical protein